MKIFSKIRSVVFICAFILTTASALAAEDGLSLQERQFLVSLSRQTLSSYLEGKGLPEVNEGDLSPGLVQKKAVFITLTDADGTLRGCMGMFEPVSSPLYQNVMDRTIAALAQDPRFEHHRVTYAELPAIQVEISVLTTPKPLFFSSPDDLLAKLRPGVDGVIVSTPYGGSTFLPQVWEQLPKKEDFLGYLFRKHGAPADYWRTNPQDIKVETYEVSHF